MFQTTNQITWPPRMPGDIHITPNLRAIAAQHIRGQEDAEGRDVGHVARRRPGRGLGPEFRGGSGPF